MTFALLAVGASALPAAAGPTDDDGSPTIVGPAVVIDVDCIRALAMMLGAQEAMGYLNDSADEEYEGSGGNVSDDRQDTYDDLADAITDTYNDGKHMWKRNGCGPVPVPKPKFDPPW
jgi:hypothetical protein